MTARCRHLFAFLALGLSACTVPQIEGPGGTDARPFVAALRQSVTVGDTIVMPLSLAEDSRCPSDVMCVQAGTVRVSVRVEKGTRAEAVVPGLGKPAQVGSSWLHLLAACPYPQASQPTPAEDYRFVLALRPSPAPAEQLTDCLV